MRKGVKEERRREQDRKMEKLRCYLAGPKPVGLRHIALQHALFCHLGHNERQYQPKSRLRERATAGTIKKRERTIATEEKKKTARVGVSGGIQLSAVV